MRAALKVSGRGLTKLSALILTCALLSWRAAPCDAQVSLAELTPGAVEVAHDLGIVPLMERLLELKAQARPGQPMSPEMLTVRLELTDRVFTAFLELRGVVAELDDQITENDEVRNYMEERRDRAIRMNNITNFVTNGALSMIGSSMQINTPFSVQNAGNEIGVVAGGLTTGISTYALKQARGGRRTAMAEPNMLTQVFDLPDPDAAIKYPDSVTIYLNDIPSGAEASRKVQLIQRWLALKRLAGIDSPEAKKRIELLAGTVPQIKAVTIDLLEDRTAMLADVKSCVSQMTRELLEIMYAIRRPSIVRIYPNPSS